jgi:uncharacterized protein YbcI
MRNNKAIPAPIKLKRKNEIFITSLIASIVNYIKKLSVSINIFKPSLNKINYNMKNRSLHSRMSFGRKQTIYIPNREDMKKEEERGKYTIKKDLLRNRIIYTLRNKLTEEELYLIIKSNNIDYFSIDTTCFLNVKEYMCMVKNITKICKEEQKLIGIIVELTGRKIQVVNL